MPQRFLLPQPVLARGFTQSSGLTLCEYRQVSFVILTDALLHEICPHRCVTTPKHVEACVGTICCLVNPAIVAAIFIFIFLNLSSLHGCCDSGGQSLSFHLYIMVSVAQQQLCFPLYLSHVRL